MNEQFLNTPQGGFAYIVEHRRRRSMGIRVKPDGEVLVAVPMRVPHALVRQFLLEKAGWVHRKLADAAEVQKSRAARSFAEGDRVTYLGRDYRLCFTSRSRLDESSGMLHLGLRGEASRDNVIAGLTRWYQRQARELMPVRTALLADRLGQHPSHVGIKSYRTRWGSCHRDGRIYFNWRLAMAPLAVVDYVAAHELCHLKHPNHSPAFWHAVERLYPDYAEQRRWLRNHGHMLDL